jgi:hypothetical protein
MDSEAFNTYSATNTPLRAMTSLLYPSFTLHTPQQLVCLRDFQPLATDQHRAPAKSSRCVRAPSSAKPDVPWVLMGRTVGLDADREGPDVPAAVDSGMDREQDRLKA